LATKSCKAAIKANHKLSFEEMKQLIIDWQKYIDGFFVCQHWRPSVVKLHKDDIDKLFDRK
jgi:DNA mismatch repair protein MutL